MNIPILYEDDWLLVVDKPSGLLVIPTPKKEQRTLTSILNEDLEKNRLAYRLHPCHRLDRDTSGIIIYAKGKSMQKKMLQLFRERKVTKTYIAFIKGSLAKKEGKINHPIDGASALTEYKVLEKRKDFAIVEIRPITGRTNQIRIHFKEIGHPVLGETRYAFRRDFKVRAKRLMLHAEELEFVHPINKKRLHLHSDLPKDLKYFLEIHT
jgi:23S rRNA pseudouridine1911/1915/1917 synthase